MSVEGRLLIQLACRQERVAEVRIGSSRPLGAVRIFAGKPVAELQRSLPLLYGVCATAQAHAARMACDRAAARTAPRPLHNAREMLVWAETAREHLGRLLLDWPRFLDEVPERRFAAPVMGLLPGLRQALFADGDAFGDAARLTLAPDPLEQRLGELEALLGEMVFVDPWPAAGGLEALQGWCGAGRSTAARFLREVLEREWGGLGAGELAALPSLADGALEERLAAADAEAFISAPRWQGQSFETGALVRQQSAPPVRAALAAYGNGLFTRLVARLNELAGVPALLREGAATLAAAEVERAEGSSGVGLAQVEAARGRLVHRVELFDGRVGRYQILAPTEWNFQAGGPLARALTGLEAVDEAQLRQQAGLLIGAIDPCVGYDLELA